MSEAAAKTEARTWDHFAPSYDRLSRFFGGRYPHVARLLRRDLGEARRVLEVGAGTGLITGPLSTFVPELVATDVSPKMLAALRQKLEGNDALQILERSVYDLGFAPASFDAVVAVNVIHIVHAPSTALTEMLRVLKPGGLLILPTFCHGATPLSRFVSRLMSRFSRFRAHTRFSPAKLAEFVQRAGATVLEVQKLGGAVPLVYLRALKDGGGKQRS